MAHRQRKQKKNHGAGDAPRYRVRGVSRDPVDISKLSKALIGLAMAEAEREAQAEHTLQADSDAQRDAVSGESPGIGGGDDA
jgi:hypothetical protein